MNRICESSNAVEVVNVSKSYGNGKHIVSVLQNLTMMVPAGSMWVILDEAAVMFTLHVNEFSFSLAFLFS